MNRILKSFLIIFFLALAFNVILFFAMDYGGRDLGFIILLMLNLAGIFLYNLLIGDILISPIVTDNSMQILTMSIGTAISWWVLYIVFVFIKQKIKGRQ